MQVLKREFYEKHEELYHLQYLMWNSPKKVFVEAKKEDFSTEIYEIKKISDKKLSNLRKTITLWKNEIVKIIFKDNYTKIVYEAVGDGIMMYLSDYKYHTDSNNEMTYFCCWIKNKDTYLSIAIFSISKNAEFAILDRYLAYSNSQTARQKRLNGTFGSCGHNSKVTMINYIFKNSSIRSIFTLPYTDELRKGLEKLGFKQS